MTIVPMLHRVAHSRRGLVADLHARLALLDRVGRAHADGHVAFPCGGHEADEHGGFTGGKDGPAYMGNGSGFNLRTDMHVGNACGGGHGGILQSRVARRARALRGAGVAARLGRLPGALRFRYLRARQGAMRR